MLDTNACIRVLNGTSPTLVERLAQHRPAEILVSSVVRAELFHGARKSRNVEKNLALLGRFFAPLGSAPFTDLCAEHYGMIRADLERTGKPIGPNDLLIAATARAYDAVLVTANTREFQRVVGLRVQNWEA
ncbi:MAG: type II toxin-antitoxin system VapC family toxin [Polyangiaceae bacterium]